MLLKLRELGRVGRHLLLQELLLLLLLLELRLELLLLLLLLERVLI